MAAKDPRRALAKKIRMSMRALIALPDADLLARHDNLMALKKAANGGDVAAYKQMMNIIFGAGAA
jgi:hypothetical protein